MYQNQNTPWPPLPRVELGVTVPEGMATAPGQQGKSPVAYAPCNQLVADTGLEPVT